MAPNANSTSERFRNSLFLEPVAYIIGAIVLALLTVAIDNRFVEGDTGFPQYLTSTVDSARTLLQVVASATITFAGIAFSISLLIIQLASSQYSPRVVQGLFRDAYNKRIMGIVVGTFAYCLVVLRAVRGPLETGGTAVIPHLSVGVATLLGIASILAIIAFINHNAHSMDVSKILSDVTEQALSTVGNVWRTEDQAEAERLDPARSGLAAVDPHRTPADDHLVVLFDRDGWLQGVDHDAIARAADPNGIVRLDTFVGRYAVSGTPLCTVWPVPEDGDAACQRARDSVIIGATRTSPQDVAYGIRQLADVALRALSTGINDPTTAQDAMFHLGTVLHALLRRRPPPRVRRAQEGRLVLLPEQITHADLVELAFDEVRIASTDQPTVCVYLLEIMHLLNLSLSDDPRRREACQAVRRQARLVVDGVEQADLLPADVDRVRGAYEDRFGDVS
jgi:uncharacterized membrane protein